MKTKWLMVVVAAVGGLLTAVNSSFAQDWTLTSAPVAGWQAIGCSADGSKLVLVSAGTTLWVSTNSAGVWSPVTVPSQFDPGDGRWVAVAASADGAKWVGAVYAYGGSYFPGPIFVSTNTGASWSPGATDRWQSVASSADGTKLVAVASIRAAYQDGRGPIYTSTNSGVTWTVTSAPPTPWQAVASSADGSKLLAAAAFGNGNGGGSIFTSTNSGGTWTESSAPSLQWTSVASSADGTKLVAASSSGGVYTSTNSGADWGTASLPSQPWSSVASSADGSKLIAVAGTWNYFGSIFTSTNFGATWTSNSAPSACWQSVAASADGGKLYVAAGGYSCSGPVYTCQAMPRPVLNIAASATNLLLSWTIPSMQFVLQQCADLPATNWADVPMLPALNLTNLQNQVIVSLCTSNRFFRLKNL